MSTMSTDLFAPVKNEVEEVVTLGIRMPKTMRDHFSALCQSKGVDASLVIRRFITQQLELAQPNSN